MIVRRGRANSKYTHDAEAVIAEILSLREFAGTTRAAASEWLAEDSEYSWSKSFFYNPWTAEFISADWKATPSQLAAAGLEEIQLWKIEEYLAHVVRQRGFSCVICGARTPFEKRGKMYDITIHASIQHRQTIAGPLLICIPCAIEIPALTGFWLPDRKRAAVADTLIQRIVAAK